MVQEADNGPAPSLQLFVLDGADNTRTCVRQYTI